MTESKPATTPNIVQSMAPGSKEAALPRAIAIAPFARLAVTTIGGISGISLRALTNPYFA